MFRGPGQRGNRHRAARPAPLRNHRRPYGEDRPGAGRDAPAARCPGGRGGRRSGGAGPAGGGLRRHSRRGVGAHQQLPAGSAAVGPKTFRRAQAQTLRVPLGLSRRAAARARGPEGSRRDPRALLRADAVAPCAHQDRRRGAAVQPVRPAPALGEAADGAPGGRRDGSQPGLRVHRLERGARLRGALRAPGSLKVKRATDTTRLEAFSDGVFAIAITLLILEIKVPTAAELERGGGLWPALAHRWPSYVGYVLSFLIIGIMWANHHALFDYIWRVDRRLIFANLLLLMGVGFLPFPTAVLAGHLADAETRTSAAVFYGATLAGIALAFNAVWWVGIRGRGLLGTSLDEAGVRTDRKSTRLNSSHIPLSRMPSS